jgi:F-type H+-transporting ATPase subunit a
VVSLQERFDAVQAAVLHHVADGHTLRLPFVQVHLPSWLSVHGLMVLLSAGLLLAVMGLAARRRGPVPRGVANVLEAFVVFVRDSMVVPYLGPEDGPRMTPLFCTFFFFILAMNLVGLVPSLFAATANLSVTGALAVVVLTFMIGGAIYRQGPVGFVKGFVPHGVPWPVLILLVPLEFAGLFIKAFALMIRLFANEMAGHVVLLFMVGMLLVFGLAAAPFLLMALFIFILELGVAFLQAYIFTLLSAIFIGQRLNPEH